MKTKTTNYFLFGFVLSLFICGACKKKVPPEVVTAAITKARVYWATSGGCVIDDKKSTAYERGVCYSTTENPTLSNYHSDISVDFGAGNFFTKTIGLSPATTYYVRAYAINEYGIGYGEQVCFTSRNAGANQMSANVFGGQLTTDEISISLESESASSTYRIKVMCERSGTGYYFLLYLPEDPATGSHSMSSSGPYSAIFGVLYDTEICSESGTINITEYDTNTGKIKGSLNFSGVNYYGGNTVNVTKGQFEFYI